jgi:hypothetical protein
MSTVNPLSSMGSLSGEIEIRLLVRKQQVEQVEIHSKRPRAIGRLLVGQTSQSALERLEWVYGLCKVAHTSALALAWAACQEGQERVVAGSHLRFQILLEAARELGLRLGKEVLNLPSDALARLIQLGQGQPARLSDVGRRVEADQALGQIKQIAEWAQTYLGDADLSRYETLSSAPPSKHVQSLSRTHSERFLRTMAEQIQYDPQLQSQAPTFMGQCMETGVLARALSKGTNIIGATEGTPVARVNCLIREMYDLIDLMRHVVNEYPTEPDCFDLGDGMAIKTSPHSAIACVETARGRLIHQVTWDKTHYAIQAYHIVAPTEWNFHPEGELHRMLMGLSGDLETVQHHARLLSQLWDPCVPISIEAVEYSFMGPLFKGKKKRYA